MNDTKEQIRHAFAAELIEELAEVICQQKSLLKEYEELYEVHEMDHFHSMTLFQQGNVHGLEKVKQTLFALTKSEGEIHE
jgi:hypothetical protein